ncbi:tetratricopeptide repeat protein [Woeseia oceani]|uniref:SH3b domain-containing protein n=1 Tax=Woeseia oceani TaxID=1548547 RepID=A0A193LJR3_9GAMM|nr:hypothetical protein [Woeseia oceani]ANO52752.1 hypothetical protein BA177_17535 [Woeseia oceani]
MCRRLGVVLAVLATPNTCAAAAAPMLLPVGTNAVLPWSFHPAWFVLLPLLLTGAVWAGCAWKRALSEDPDRLRRAGLRELKHLLARVRRCRTGPAPVHLHAWLRAAARTWNVGDAAPTCDQLADALRACNTETGLAQQWCDLWCTTERSVFAAEQRTPSNWIDRATLAATAVRLPPRTHWYPNRISHWLPVTLVVVIFIVSVPALSLAGSAEGSTDNSEPTKATPAVNQETTAYAAQQALTSAWNDWAAHYNIAIAAMQAGDPGNALGHATAAFVQQPGSRVVRNNLRNILLQVETADPVLHRLLSGSSVQRLPVLASPAVWQRVALLASLMLAAGLSLVVITLYRPTRRRQILLAGCGIGMTGVVILGVAVMSWKAYGSLNKPTAAIAVQSVNLSPAPTDLVPEEETIPVQPGNIVIRTGRDFLGWQQVEHGRDQGWVRHIALLPLYASDGP